MEKNTQGIVAVFALLALLVGFALGAVLMGEDTIVTTETVKEVPVNVTVEKIVEIQAPSQLDLAKVAFMNAVEDEEDEAGNDVDVLGNYNFDEVKEIKTYDEYTVSYDDDKVTVEFSIRLQFDDGDDRVKEVFDVKVVFEVDEDTIVEVN